LKGEEPCHERAGGGKDQPPEGFFGGREYNGAFCFARYGRNALMGSGKKEGEGRGGNHHASGESTPGPQFTYSIRKKGEESEPTFVKRHFVREPQRRREGKKVTN